MALKTERNLKIHAVIALLVLAFSYVMGLTRTELLMVYFAIALVILSELFNTAIEMVVDLVVHEYDERARKIKDISAAAVLVSAIFAVCVAYIIFIG